jgi:divalent metal cation (Fe/Co/Zn/Cd) transporter
MVAQASVTPGSSRSDRTEVVRRGRTLSRITLGYNTLEGLASLIAGAMAGSVSLVGFGVDSLIEVTSSAASLWRLRLDHDASSRERSERITIRIIGWCFLALAAYIAWEAGHALWTQTPPERTIPGIVIAGLSVIVMPLLSRAKGRVAIELGSRALSADAKQTDLCAYLSAILLAGLVLNAVFGWWWADPVAALLMVPIIAREGIEGLRGEEPCLRRDLRCSPPAGKDSNAKPGVGR